MSDTITTTFVGVLNGMNVWEVYKDGVLIGTNVSAPPDDDQDG